MKNIYNYFFPFSCNFYLKKFVHFCFYSYTHSDNASLLVINFSSFCKIKPTLVYL